MANLNPLRKILRNLSLATTGMTAAILALASVDALSFLGPAQGPALMTMSFCWVAYGAVRSKKERGRWATSGTARPHTTPPASTMCAKS